LYIINLKASAAMAILSHEALFGGFDANVHEGCKNKLLVHNHNLQLTISSYNQTSLYPPQSKDYHTAPQ
jgi:hypothetical protein